MGSGTKGLMTFSAKHVIGWEIIIVTDIYGDGGWVYVLINIPEQLKAFVAHKDVQLRQGCFESSVVHDYNR